MRAIIHAFTAAVLLAISPIKAQHTVSTGTVNNQHKRPNILIIMTDQHSATMLSCTGNKWLKTPALDALSAGGIRFEKAYVTNPVCMPSRFSIQTGLLASSAGIRENAYTITPERKALIEGLYSRSLGHTFRNAGYDTYYGGKFHVPIEGPNATNWGYNVITRNDRENLALNVSDFLVNRKPESKPFLLFASLINPHDICFDAIGFGDPEGNEAKATPPDLFEAKKIPEGISKKEFFDKYCPPLPDNHQPMIGESYSVDSLIRLRNFRKVVRDNWTEEEWRLHRWAYARLTEKVDVLIGQILGALDRSGQRENTIILFTADHGEMDGAHKLEHKTVFYEESARVPFIISYPGLKNKGKVDNQHLVSNGLDIFPTLCELAQIQPPKGLQGKSLVPLLNEKKINNWRTEIFIESQLGYLIHSGRYKYQLDDKHGQYPREVFSDLQSDPGEKFNLIKENKYSDAINGLKNKLFSHLTASKIAFVPPGL
jgi:choline-sulfatase